MFIDHKQVETILADRRVRGVKFTGSTEGGKSVAMLAAQNMKKGCFELGGNDAFVVLKDANLKAAVEAAYASRMGCGGQMCNAAKRFILEEPIYDEFKDMLIEKIKSATVIGDPEDHAVTLGPMAGEAHLDKLRSQVERATKEGRATHVYGDLNIRKSRPELAAGNYTDVIVLEGIDEYSPIAHEELFGPVFNLYKVQRAIDAFNLANHTDYGLSATVFTEDEEKAKLAALRIRSGNVFVNDRGYTGPDFPSGGIKGSGYGRECYSDGILDAANRKTIIYKK